MKRSTRKRTRGAAVVETAIVLPVIVLLTFGFIEIGRYVDRVHILHNAARQGARTAARLENSNAEVEATVFNAFTNSLDVSASDITVRIAKLNSAGSEEYQIMRLDESEQGFPIRVTVTVDYAQLDPLSNFVGLASRSVSSSAVMRRHK